MRLKQVAAIFGCVMIMIAGCSKPGSKSKDSSKTSNNNPNLYQAQSPKEIPTASDLSPSPEKVGDIADQARIRSEIYQKIQTPTTGIDEVIRIEKNTVNSARCVKAAGNAQANQRSAAIIKKRIG
jgi:hypothetical protein